MLITKKMEKCTARIPLKVKEANTRTKRGTKAFRRTITLNEEGKKKKQKTKKEKTKYKREEKEARKT